jgi:hypothetical protein
MRSRLAAALVVIGVLVGLASGAQAAQGRTPREAALFDGQAEVSVQQCGVDASATVLAVLTGTAFDVGSAVSLDVDAPNGVTARVTRSGSTMEWPIHLDVSPAVAAGTHEVRAVAAGLRGGLPATVSDVVRIRISC